jgi:hypothetical protein
VIVNLSTGGSCGRQSLVGRGGQWLPVMVGKLPPYFWSTLSGPKAATILDLPSSFFTKSILAAVDTGITAENIFTERNY